MSAKNHRKSPSQGPFTAHPAVKLPLLPSYSPLPLLYKKSPFFHSTEQKRGMGTVNAPAPRELVLRRNLVRHIVEARIFTAKGQRNCTGRATTMFRDNHVRFTYAIAIGVIHVLAM